MATEILTNKEKIAVDSILKTTDNKYKQEIIEALIYLIEDKSNTSTFKDAQGNVDYDKLIDTILTVNETTISKFGKIINNVNSYDLLNYIIENKAYGTIATELLKNNKDKTSSGRYAVFAASVIESALNTSLKKESKGNYSEVHIDEKNYSFAKKIINYFKKTVDNFATSASVVKVINSYINNIVTQPNVKTVTDLKFIDFLVDSLKYTNSETGEKKFNLKAQTIENANDYGFDITNLKPEIEYRDFPNIWAKINKKLDKVTAQIDTLEETIDNCNCSLERSLYEDKLKKLNKTSEKTTTEMARLLNTDAASFHLGLKK